jgi:hypothetical protein
MHTVVETPPFLVAATKAGMSEVEREAAIDLIAANRSAGEIIVGGGGVRKIRVPGHGKGKSGGYRILTYYMSENRPVYLMWVLNKSMAANLSDAQKAMLKEAAKEIRNG